MTEIRTLLTKWKTKKFNDTYKILINKRLYTSDGELPRVYGLTKVHKDGYSLRIIISCIVTVLSLIECSF